MKTLLITLEYPPFYGGVAHYYGNLVSCYPESLDVLNNNNNELLRKNWKWLPAIFNLSKALIQKKYRYVLVGHILPLGTTAWICSFLFNFRYAVFIHGYDLNCALAKPRKAWLAKKILARADKIISANSYIAEKIKTLIDQKELGKIKLVNPGINGRLPYDEKKVQELKKLYDLDGKIVLFSLGRLVRRKGFGQVIKALPEIISKNENLIYYIAGVGPDEEYLRDLAKELLQNLRDKIKFLGSVSEAEKWLWLDVCDIFIMPTLEPEKGDIEGFGIVYLESALAGKPVIAGRSGGTADAVIDNETGLLVNSENLEEISQSVVKLANYEGLRRRLGDQGRQRAIAKFGWKQQAQKVYDIINKN